MSSVIWPWRDRDALEKKRVIALRRGGAIRALVAAIAASLLFYFHRPTGAGIAAAVSVLTLSLSLLSPTRAYSALLEGVSSIGEAVGTALTWTLLTPVFYLFFLPFGLLFRRGRGDRMGRRFEPERASYWTKREKEKPGSLERPY